MALVTVAQGQQAVSNHVEQIVDLLTGAMSDQPVTLANTLAATAVKASGLTGSVAATRYVGGTATAAPTTGPHLLGDWVIAQDGFLWICTVPGTPGTWKLGGADLASATPLALAAAGAVGTSLKASREDHVHPWTGLAVLSLSNTFTNTNSFGNTVTVTAGGLSVTGGIAGTLTTASQGNVTSLGTLTSLTVSGNIAANGGMTLPSAISISLNGGSSILQDDGTFFYVGFSRAVYIRNTVGTTYIYSNQIYLGDGATGGNQVHFRNDTLDGTSWSITSAGAGILTSLAMAAGSITGNDWTLPANSGAITQASWSGSAWTGSQYQSTLGWNGQARQLFTANTRSDPNAVEGDILFNA